MIFLLAALALQSPVLEEADAYTVEYFTPPAGAVLEVGGMDFLSDGRLVLSTRRGQVWIVDGVLGDDVANAKFTLFCEGLWEGLGLKVVDDDIYVVQRGELSRLRDVDGDGTCDAIDTIADGWGVSGHYHEFAFGLPRDAEGNWYVGLNVSFGDPEWWHGRSTVRDRGWIVRVSPDGAVTPWAMGFRSPCGVAMDSRGRVFVTDNQGDWCASSPIHLLRKGGFYGHPKSLNWTPEYLENGLVAHDEIPPAIAATGREPAVVWIPYKWSRSTGNLLEDTSAGKFGPSAGQYVVAELTNGMLLRADFEEVQGVLQGWVTPLRQELGSVVRVLQAEDGSVLCGLTNRGWGGRAPADGLARVRFTGNTPMEIASMQIVDADDEGRYGFRLRFTRPIAKGWAPAGRVALAQYDYDYWWEYGSPERHTTECEVQFAELSPARDELVIRSDGLYPAMVARVKLRDVAADDGSPLLHPEVAYTVNQLPSGPKTTALVAKIVPPPPTKNGTAEGILHLSWGDALGQFVSDGWQLCSATLDSADPTRFRTAEGNGALVNDAAQKPSHFATLGEFGDVEAHVEFMLPENGNSGVYLMGRYEVQLRDSHGVKEPGYGDCGGIYRSDDWPGRAPLQNGYRGPGDWHELDVIFRAPRFGVDGDKVEDALFVSVLIDGAVVQENVRVPGPTVSAMFEGEATRGPLVLQGDHGPVAYRNFQVKPLDRPFAGEGWRPLGVREAWDDWESSGDAAWELDGDELVGQGALGYLWSPRDDYADLRLRCRAKINSNGAAAIVLRASEAANGDVDGYAVRINSSYPGGELTGTIPGLAPVATELVAADTWFDLEIGARDTAGGSELTVMINGVLVNRFVDRDARFARGGVAIESRHDGSVVRLRDLEVRE